MVALVRTVAALTRVALTVLTLGAMVYVWGMAGGAANSAVAASGVPSG